MIEKPFVPFISTCEDLMFQTICFAFCTAEKKLGITVSLDEMWSAFSDTLQNMELTNQAGLNAKLQLTMIASVPIYGEGTSFGQIHSNCSSLGQSPNNGDGCPFVLFMYEGNELSALARAGEQPAAILS
jgi:hypothetical protein